MGLQIKKLRQENHLTQSEIAKKIGVSPSAFAMYERGEREPGIDMLKKISDVFNVNIDTLVGRHPPVINSKRFVVVGPDGKLLDDGAKYSTPRGVKIPVLGYVAAGVPIEAITDILDYEEIDADLLKDGSEYFALKIKGASMEPKMSDGDVVIVRKQPDIDSGQIGIVCVNGDEATCKKIMKQEGGILLQPLNPAYQTVFYGIEQIEQIPITILGRVIELRAKF